MQAVYVCDIHKLVAEKLLPGPCAVTASLLLEIHLH